MEVSHSFEEDPEFCALLILLWRRKLKEKEDINFLNTQVIKNGVTLPKDTKELDINFHIHSTNNTMSYLLVYSKNIYAVGFF